MQAFIWLKNKNISKLFAKPSKKVVDIQPKPVPASPQTAIVPKPQTPVPVSEGTDTVKLHEDAIRFIKRQELFCCRKHSEKALLEKPDNAVMHNNLGLALRNQGKHKEALTYYGKALKLQPDYYEAMNNLAVTYEMLGDNKRQSFSIKGAFSEALIC